jgi:hypothetical protein
MSLLVTTPAVRPESRASFANFTLSMLSGSPPPKELYACGWREGSATQSGHNKGCEYHTNMQRIRLAVQRIRLTVQRKKGGRRGGEERRSARGKEVTRGEEEER